uniref:Ell-associated factor Eaf n=1 Tax=Syphacia muris TaxID=451379 RepID=A0A0N5ARD5_9BILA
MAEAREIPAGTYNLKLGETFQNNEEKSAYHTLRFDFKPKSVASESETFLAFGGNGDVQVAVPGEGDSLTIYKGSQKAVKQDKECLLFFDPDTGELRLEKLTSNISVKKTRLVVLFRDTDETNVNFLRNEIQKLRGASNVDDEEMDDGRSTSSSSSSSSSDSSDRDSDSDSSSGETPAGVSSNDNKNVSSHFGEMETSSDEEDVNNSGSGEDDDDLQGWHSFFHTVLFYLIIKAR